MDWVHVPYYLPYSVPPVLVVLALKVAGASILGSMVWMLVHCRDLKVVLCQGPEWCYRMSRVIPN